MQNPRTQTTTFYKVRVHVNLDGNEQADALAKLGCKKNHINATTPYEHTTSTYYLQKRLVALKGRISKQRPHHTFRVHTNYINSLKTKI